MVGLKKEVMMFDHFSFFSKEMGIILATLFVNSFVILSAFQVQGSAGDGFTHYYVVGCPEFV